MNIRNIKLKVIATLFLLVYGKVNAAPVAYDELTSGDLSQVQEDFLNFQFDIGINTISGNWSGIWPSTVDRDGFSFTVPDGAEVTDVTYEFDDSEVSLTDGYWLTPQFFLTNSTGIISRQNMVLPTEVSPFPTPESPAQLFSDVWPLEADTYSLIHNLSFLTLGTAIRPIADGDGGVVPYTWSFTLGSLAEESPPIPSAVPVPAAVWLFGTALVGFIGLSRRRKVA